MTPKSNNAQQTAKASKNFIRMSCNAPTILTIASKSLIPSSKLRIMRWMKNLAVKWMKAAQI